MPGLGMRLRPTLPLQAAAALLLLFHIMLTTSIEFYIYIILSLQSGSFYTLFPDGMFGSTSYMAKAVVNRMLQEGLQYDPNKTCVLS